MDQFQFHILIWAIFLSGSFNAPAKESQAYGIALALTFTLLGLFPPKKKVPNAD